MQDDISFTLYGLNPATAYQAVVCRPFFLDVDIVDPIGLWQCGFCAVCFQTDRLVIRFEETSVIRLNDTHVNLTCRVTANVDDIFIEWSAISTVPGERPRRRFLFNGGRYNGQRVLIDLRDETVSLGPRIEFGVASVLVAPSSILEGDIRCDASSQFDSRRSMPGAFQGTYNLLPLS